MNIFEYIKNKITKTKALSLLSINKHDIAVGVSEAKEAKYEFFRYMRGEASDLISALNEYNDLYYKYCKAYYENELLFRTIYKDKSSLALFDQIDSLSSTIYESKPVDDTPEELEHHNLVVTNAKDILDAILYKNNDPRFAKYFQNCKLMAELPSQINSDNYPVIRLKLPRAKDLYNRYVSTINKTKRHYDTYTEQLEYCKSVYPESCRSYSDIMLPEEIYSNNNLVFQAVEEHLNMPLIATRAKSYVLDELASYKNALSTSTSGK